MQPLTLLVIDDTRSARDTAVLAAEMLANELGRPIITLTAESGLEGADLLRKHAHITVVLLDIHLPGSDLDGRLISGLIGELHPGARILPFTADRTPEMAADLQALGMDAPVMKPITPQLLANRLRKALQQPEPSERPPLQGFLANQTRKMAQLIEQGGTARLKTVALLAQDHLTRAGLSYLLEKASAYAPITLIQPASTEAQLRAEVQMRRVQLLVCSPDALRQAEELATTFGIPLLIYTSVDTAQPALGRLWSVIVGPAKTTELVQAIQQTIAGEQYRQPHIEAVIQLNPRQHRIIKLLTEGASNAQIAAAINVSENWVRHVMIKLYEQLGVEHNRGALLTWANEAPLHLLNDRNE